VDAIRRLSGAALDLLHLAVPANVSAGVTPLGVPLFQPPLGANDTCYAIGYADERRGRYRGTEAVLLRVDAKRRCDENALCLAVSRKPRSCSVRVRGRSPRVPLARLSAENVERNAVERMEKYMRDTLRRTVIIDEKKSRNIIASNTKKKKNYINTPIMS
jgi:hypothetical protein